MTDQKWTVDGYDVVREDKGWVIPAGDDLAAKMFCNTLNALHDRIENLEAKEAKAGKLQKAMAALGVTNRWNPEGWHTCCLTVKIVRTQAEIDIVADELAAFFDECRQSWALLREIAAMDPRETNAGGYEIDSDLYCRVREFLEAE